MQQLHKRFQLHPCVGDEMLFWKDKKKVTEVDYVQATVCEMYGEKSQQINQLIHGNNLDALCHLMQDYQGKVQLIYIDPPFESQTSYRKKIILNQKEQTKSFIYETQYCDYWTKDDYLQFMYERLLILKELLAETGSIYVHCDWRKVHYLRMMMDEIFGVDQYRNEIVWKRGSVKGAKAKGQQFARNHDTILFYSKSDKYTFNRQYIPFDKEYIKRFNKDDGDGRGPYRDDQAIGTRSKKAIEQLIADNRIFEHNGKLKIKTYLNELKGIVMDDNWCDIAEVNVMSKARTFYPTQKPEALLERIIKTSSNEGDLILDCFMGSGTTIAVANKLSRGFIGCDDSRGALQTTISRLAVQQTSFTVKTVAEKVEKQVGNIQVSIDLIQQQLQIMDFNPTELIEKLQAQKIVTNDWRALVESIKIDWYYNQKVFHPTVVEYSTLNVLNTSFAIPNDAGKIFCIQITDLLSMRYEVLVYVNDLR